MKMVRKPRARFYLHAILKSFPMCGFASDSWVAAIRRTGSYIPPQDLGEKHEDWGMVFVDKKPSVTNRKRQHASYKVTRK